MSLDLPQNAGTRLLDAAASSHQLLMQESQGNVIHANGMLRAQSNQKFGEISTTEAVANKTVANTPIGTPNTPAGAN